MLPWWLWALAALGALGLAVGWYARFVEPRRLLLRRRVLQCPRLPQAFEGLTILHVSDTHVDAEDSEKAHRLASLRALQPDLVVLTGDFTDADGGIELCARTLGQLRGRLGVFAVLGNHDYRTYRFVDLLVRNIRPNRLRDVEPLRDAFRCQGIRVLQNEHLPLDWRGQRLWLVGVDDRYSDREDLPRSLAGIPQEGFKILLSHSPEILSQVDGNRVDLVFSGHTHGGQIRLPLIGALRKAVETPLEEARGVISRNGTMMHISAGIGTVFLPVRFLCPPEATLIELRRGETPSTRTGQE